MTRSTLNRGSIQLRKLITINKSLGIIVPSTFVKKLQLKPGQYMGLDLNKECNSIVVRKLNLG